MNKSYLVLLLCGIVVMTGVARADVDADARTEGESVDANNCTTGECRSHIRDGNAPALSPDAKMAQSEGHTAAVFGKPGDENGKDVKGDR